MPRIRVPAVLRLALCAALASPAMAQEYFTTQLLLDGRLGISIVDAVQIEKRLGQLLVVNVDGFGTTGSLAVTQGYLDLLSRVQVGGVIPHYGRSEYGVLRATNAELARRTRAPLLIASDIVTLSAIDGSRAQFGDGYVGGFIGKHRALSDAAFARLAFLNAFVCRALGMGCALWPTVDASTREARVEDRARAVLDALDRFGILVTLKHWPFVPEGVDLHRESVDSALPLAEVERLAAPFRSLAARGDILMTTHVSDSLVEAGLVTLSPRWIDILSKGVSFAGPLITDGLFMLRSHRVQAVGGEPVPGLGSAGDDEIAGWAARALLAGHDLLIVEGTAASSLHVYERLLELACRGDDYGRRVRERIMAACAKVAALKERRRADLAASIDAPAALIDRIVALVARGAAGLADDVAYRGIEAEVTAICGSLPSWKGGVAR
jgi:hypothetical protein